MSKRLQQTMADLLVIAVSPALIMTLVGSFVYFLLSVLYTGEYLGRLYWVMTCFIFAAVLISRISIEQGWERAMPFGLALAIVVAMATNRFLEVQHSLVDRFSFFINCGIIGLIWWCAHRLTWDCTVIDEQQDASGEGLLQVAGLEKQADSSDLDTRGMEGTTSKSPPGGWWQRYVEKQRRPHAPGVWVVYFSLAALPLFGIGQRFIPTGDVALRRWAFTLLCVYAASGLALLLTTSFLGLRRYLRQRQLEMPAAMAGVWLTSGAALIVALLAVAAFLPRPSAEFAISELPFAVGSPTNRASRLAPVPHEGAKGERPGPAPDKNPDPDAPRDATAPQGKGLPDPQGKPSDSGGDGKASGEGKSSSDKNGNRKQDSNSSDAAAKQSDKSPSSAERQPNPQSAKNSQRDNEPSNAADRSQQESKNNRAEPGRDSKQQPQISQPQVPRIEPQAPNLQNLTAPLTNLFKWIFYGIIALGLLFLLWKYWADVLRTLGQIWAELVDFWNGLFGRRRRGAKAGTSLPDFDIPPPPFASFADPFASGIAGRSTPAELVRYSFEAFEAWSREHGCPRQLAQTPHELARDVSKVSRTIANSARELAELHACAAYDQRDLPQTTTKQLERLWREMRASSVGGVL